MAGIGTAVADDSPPRASVAEGIDDGTTNITQEAIVPPLRPSEWRHGDGQFPEYVDERHDGYDGWLEKKSDDRAVELRYEFDRNDFDEDRGLYLLVARVAWNANGAGQQRGIETNTDGRDLPGGPSDYDWGTVRLPIEPEPKTYVSLNAIYGYGTLASGTSLVRVENLAVVPADAVGDMSDEEILAAVSEGRNDTGSSTGTDSDDGSDPTEPETGDENGDNEPTEEDAPAGTDSSADTDGSETASSSTTAERGLLYPGDGLLQHGLDAWMLSVLGLLLSIAGVLYTIWRRD